ncbi:MAG: AsmA family protein [Burkholderiales bacterium]|nr:AsmA family protein [Burkholderiales bacterium]
MKLPSPIGRALRWLLAALALIVLLPVVAAVVIVSFEITLSAGPWRDRLGEAATRRLGRAVTFEGPLELVPSLQPQIKVGGIRIANPPGFSSPDFAYLGEARLHVDLGALVGQAIRVHELSAENVRVNLELAADGRANWRFAALERDARRVPAEDAARAPDLSGVSEVDVDVRDVSLRNLSVEYFAAAAGSRHYFQLEELKAAAPHDQPVTVRLRGNVEKKFPYALTFTGGKVSELFASEVNWPVRLGFDFLGTALQVEGTVSRNVRGEQLDLLLGLGTEDLTQVERLLQIELPELGATALSARVRWDGPRIELSQLRGVMGRTTLEGDLRYDAGGPRPKLSGALILPTLDLRPFLGMQAAPDDEPPRSLLDTYRELEQQTFSLRVLSRMDADLDLSVARWLSLPGDVRDARLKLELAAGRLHAPVQATIAQVPLEGVMDVDGSAPQPTFLLELKARRTRLGGLAELLAGVRGVQGDVGSFLFRLAGQGENLGQLTRTVDVRLGIEDGRLSYGNLEGGRPVEFRLDDFEVRLPSAKPLSGRARGTLLQESFDARFSATDLPTLARTLRSPIELRARATGATLQMQGTLAAPQADGGSELRFRLAAERAGDVGRWLGLSPKANVPLLLEGRARATADEWRLSDYRFRLGNTRMSGEFARVGLRTSPLIQARLDVQRLDVPELDSMLPPSPPEPKDDAPRNTLDLPILPQGIDLSDADVAVRVEHVAMKPAHTTDVAFDGRIRQGRMEPSPFSARIAGTAFSGAIALDLRGSVPQASLWVAANAVDVGELLRRLNVAKGIQAQVDSLRLQLIGRGSRLGEMLAKSELDANLEDGSLVLTDPAGKPLVKVDVDNGRALAEPGQPMRVDLHGMIDETPVAIGVTTGTALSFLAGEDKVPFALRAQAAGAILQLDGRVKVPITQAEGELGLRIQGERLDSMNRLARVELPPWGPWSLSGRFVASARGYEVPDLALRVGDSRLVGQGSYVSAAQRPRVDVKLAAPRVQLDDFQFGTWSPFERKASGAQQNDSTMDVEQMRARAKEAAAEGQRLLSPETLRRMDAYLDVRVDEVLSGSDRLGSGALHAQLAQGRLEFGPAQVEVPGGSARFAATYEPTGRDVAVSMQIAADRFDYGILARRVKPGTDFEGLVSLHLDISGRAPTLDAVMAHSDGRIDVAVWPRNMRAGIFDLWAVNLFMALVPAVDPSKESRVNCAIGRFDLRDGKLTQEALLIDTSRMRVIGEGKVDFDSERLDFRLSPKAKSAQFFSLATPISATGTLSDPEIGVAPGGVAETTLRLLTSIFVVPIQKLVQGRLPRDGKDVCSAGVRAIEQGPAAQ